ncbi:hypothetical protein SXCC_04249 [Gluconacetobacter sp. SXCC-1]|nr:hypothetical protein SXCC_04249 [Gluconacetobacter sp. SXCC-1]
MRTIRCDDAGLADHTYESPQHPSTPSSRVISRMSAIGNIFNNLQ